MKPRRNKPRSGSAKKTSLKCPQTSGSVRATVPDADDIAPWERAPRDAPRPRGAACEHRRRHLGRCVTVNLGGRRMDVRETLARLDKEPDGDA
jgi:hypothetical protein